MVQCLHYEASQMDQNSKSVDLHIPAQTFFRIFIAIGLAAALIRIAPLLLVFLLSALLAVTLHPIVCRLQRKGVPRFISIGLVAVGIIAISILKNV